MDVSNSTGQNTGYRVLGSGGAAPRPPKGGAREKEKAAAAVCVMYSGTLEPHTYVALTMPDEAPCVVQFLRNDKVIAQQEVKHREVLIALVPNGKGAPKPYVLRKA